MNDQTKPQPGGAAPLSAPMPTKEQNKPLSEVATLGELLDNVEFRRRVAQSAPEHMTGDRLLRVFAMAVRNTPGLMEVSPLSFAGACLTTTQIGLEPNTPLQHAFLIPFKENKWNPQKREREYVRTIVQWIPGYRGLAQLSYNSGQVTHIHPDIVWKPDEDAGRFDFEYGSNQRLFHKPLYVPRDLTLERETPIYAYAHAKLVHGEGFIVWPWEEVLRIRAMSQGYQTAMRAFEKAKENGWSIPASYTEAPWIKHWRAMARKTMVRAISNMLPRSVELAYADHIDAKQDRRAADLSNVIDAEYIGKDERGHDQFDYAGAAAKAAEETNKQAEQEEQDQRATDGRAGSVGSAFTDRRPAAGQTAGQTKPPAGQTKRPDPPAPAWTPPPFEETLIDAFGEPGETFTDAVTFAEAIMVLWGEATDQDQVDALLEHNEGSIEQARQVPDAASLLDPIDQPRDFAPADAGPPSFEAVPVPQERGKPSWPAWVAACKEAITGLPPAYMAVWLEAQKANIAQAPMSPRITLLRAISATLQGAQMQKPAWLDELMTTAPKSPAKPTQAKPGAAAAQGALLPGAAEAQGDEAFAKEAARRIRGCADLAALDAYCKEISPIMWNLGRSNPTLRDEIFAVAEARNAELKAPSPPPDDGDPGPETVR